MSGGLGISRSGEWRAAGRELLARISPGQRVAIVVVALIGIAALAWASVQARRVIYVQVAVDSLDPTSADLGETRARLDAAGIRWREPEPSGDAPGDDAIIEVAQLDLERARRELADFSASASDDGGWDSGSIFGAVVPSSERRLREKLRRIETDLCASPRIVKASVESAPAPRDLRARETARGSAAVNLTLARRVERLSPVEVATIRVRVAAALGIAEDGVAISDHRLRLYRREDDGTERDLREQDLRNAIRALYAGRFVEGEQFDFEARVARRRPLLAGVQGGLMSAVVPAVLPRALAAGVVRGGPIARGDWEAGVLVRFDEETVRRALEQGDAVAGTESEFRAAERRVVERIVERELGSERRWVQVEVCRLRRAPGGRPYDFGAAARTVGEEVSSPAESDATGAWIERGLAGLDEFWAAVRARVDELPGGGRTAAAALFLSGAFALATLAARARKRRRRARAAAAARADSKGVSPVPPRGPDAALAAQDRMSQRVEEHPQAAAAVLRLWLSEDEFGDALDEDAAVTVADGTSADGPISGGTRRDAALDVRAEEGL